MTNYEMAKATGFQGTFEEWNSRHDGYDPLKEIDDLIKNTFPNKEKVNGGNERTLSGERGVVGVSGQRSRMANGTGEETK